MILLNEVMTKLEKILNGLDSEVGATGSIVQATNPTDFYFQVETEGFHIDHIQKPDGTGNFIPVFIASMGGQFNPVRGLKQGSYTLPIAFYFPVRFKQDFYALSDFLCDAFIGTILNYGEVSGKAVSNVSAPQFGEIQNIDFKEFQKWHDAKFTKPIEKMEPYMTMEMTLYLSTSAPEFVWGNDAKASLSLDAEKYDDDLTFTQGGINSNSEPASQQILGEKESDGLPTATSYASGFTIYVKNTTFYQYLIEQWFLGNAQSLAFDFSFTFLNKTFTRKVYMHTVNLMAQKGQLATITFAFAKKVVLE